MLAPHLRGLTALIILVLAVGARAQNVYAVRKNQLVIETNAVPSGPGLSLSVRSPPTGGFTFSATASTRATLTLPNGNSVDLPPSSGGGFELNRAFDTQAALDAAYPNGTYRMTGIDIPTLTFSLSPESYPASSPGVTRTNWSNGLNVVDPDQSATFTFGTTASYATAAIGAHMSFEVQGLTDNVSRGTEIWNRAVLGAPATPSPLTSFVLPAGSLTRGRVYQAELAWDIATTLDTTSIPGALVAAAFSKATRFYVVARGPNDPVPTDAPAFDTTPTSQVGGVGGTVTLAFAVSPNSPAQAILWFREGQQLDIDGTKYSLNGGALTIHNLTTDDAGRYYAEALNPAGLIITGTVSVNVTNGPAIIRPPVSVTVAPGSTAVFSVGASGSSALTYQWRLNGVALPSTITTATSPILVLPNATAAQAGTYTVTVSGSGGPPAVGTATLTIAAATAAPGRLVNLSILTPLATGEVLTIGTVLGGAGTGGTKPLLVRAGGPALAQLGVSSVLPDPILTLNAITSNAGTVIASNDDWRGDSALVNAFNSVGAFPFASASSRDAAVFRTDFTAGNYTMEVRDAGAGSGTVIAELYDGTAANAFTASTPRLINVSVLKATSAGDSLTAGFVIGGATAKTVLVRAVGPGLAALGVRGAMADPQLTLRYTSLSPSVIVAANNDWAGASAISGTAAAVGAFAVSDPTSRDAMLLLTLAPGNYTAEMSPVAGTSGGLAIVEIYEVP